MFFFISHQALFTGILMKLNNKVKEEKTPLLKATFKLLIFKALAVFNYMKTAVEENFKKAILNYYPAPIAFACRKIFEPEGNYRGEDVVAVYQSFWNFVGLVLAADYVERGAQDDRINLLLLFYAFSLNEDRWIDLIIKINELSGGSKVMPGLNGFLKGLLYVSMEPVRAMNRFKKRLLLNRFPPDPGEIAQAKSVVFKILWEAAFLSEYVLISADSLGVYQMFGLNQEVIYPDYEIELGDIFLTSRNNPEIRLRLNPFLIQEESERNFAFAVFRKDRNAYEKLLEKPPLQEALRKYQKYLEGKPDFTSIESRRTEAVFIADLRDKLNRLIQSDSHRRILVEGYPGSGKTALCLKLEELVDVSSFTVIKYFLTKGGIENSGTIFARFLYTSLNEILDNPHPIAVSYTHLTLPTIYSV